jgi:hypothetical protein
MNDFCLFTIISKNYIAHARALTKSFLKHHPGTKTFVLLADKIDGYFDPSQEAFEVVEADQLGIKDFDSFSFKYNIMEFNTAVKPFFFETLFAKGFKSVVYLDPDILVFKPLDEILTALDRRSIILTPHMMTPIPEDGKFPTDTDILKAGGFNLGFIALSKGEVSGRLLSWWKERLYDKCRQGPFSGYGVDQVWLSLVPCFFDNYYVLKNPGYNVAYWNLHERTVTREGDEFFVNGHPLFFFHFSGFIMEKPGTISKIQKRYDVQGFPVLGELFTLYKRLLIENGYMETKQWPYYYGLFKNGSKISELARGIYLGLGIKTDTFGDPFERFWGRLLNIRYFRTIFSKHFVQVMLDKFFLYIWKCILRNRSKGKEL